MSEALKAKGNAAFSTGDFVKAEKLYSDAAKVDPQNPVLYSNRAMALLKLSKYIETIECCDRGLHLSPGPKPKLKLLWRAGIAYLRLNDFRNAKQQFDEALKIDPNNPSILTSIEELNTNESKFKRSHSIEEIKSEKRTKTDCIQQIPIYEIDQLPEEFTQENYSKKLQGGNKLFNQSAKPTPPNEEAPTHPVNLSKYPRIPSAIDLSRFAQSAAQDRQHDYEYVLSFAPKFYAQLYCNGNIERSVLEFILDALLYLLRSNRKDIHNQSDRVVEYLEVLATIPRFQIVHYTLDMEKVLQIEQGLEYIGNKEVLENVLSKWR